MKNYFYLSGSGNKKRKKKINFKFFVLFTPLLLLAFFTSYFLKKDRSDSFLNTEQNEKSWLKKEDLSQIIASRINEIENKPVLDIITENGQNLFIRTTINSDLQNQAMRWLKSSLAHQAALVVMDVENGEVLALAGYRAKGGESTAALDGSFPAASLFKIVTAAAAVEQADYSADSKLAYDGGKYTLYKKSLAREPNRGIHQSTLENSFAESINTVFGKLGVFSLGPEELVKYAERFGFNSHISFELPVDNSNFSIDNEDSFHIAELASGYNRSTKVSPLHGAMMAASIASGGALIEPTLVKEIFDHDNQMYYYKNTGPAKRVVNKDTAEELSRMMIKTIEDGTGRKGFGGASRHPVLSKLSIGGKSGTINNDEGQRVDWFVAFVRPKDPNLKGTTLALSAVVVHGNGSATHSQKLIRQAIVSYYKDKLEPQITSVSGPSSLSGRLTLAKAQKNTSR